MGGAASSLVWLPRGGVLILTSGGPVQFGVPSETIKDTIKRKDGVPCTYIIPQFMFDQTRGVALADVEFPIYYNFFLKKRKTNIVCTKRQREGIVKAVSEALFGPEEIDITDEYFEGENTPGFPDLRAEMNHFRSQSASARGKLDLDDLIAFHIFDEKRRASVGNINVQFDAGHNLKVSEGGRLIGSVGRKVQIMPEETDLSKVDLNFRPPLFGITTLGAGHGFDPDANTSGFIIWVNRRGIVVDPPVNSTQHLLRLGISPKLIDKIILTHCHADHDAGTLQKIRQEGRIDLYTTKTIFRSFIRKSAALTGFEEKQLMKLVNFFPVVIGKTTPIGGCKFEFNYTLHSIPTISIRASLAGKRMVYSSDTMNDPQYIDQLFRDGVLSKSRRDILIDFPWDSDVIFHEAGIPPIHTPMQYLCSLPEETRNRTYLVHVSQDAIPAGCGLKIAPTGLLNTVALDVNPLPYDEAIDMLDAVANIDLFEQLGFKKAREFLLAFRIDHYDAGQVIFRQGDRGDKFYIVMKGEIEIVLDGRVITTYGLGGYFGEKSLFTDETRTATAIARSKADLLTIGKDELLSLIRGSETEQILRQVAMFQNEELRNLLKKNVVFCALTATQQTELHALIKPYSRHFQTGETIVKIDTIPDYVFIIREGNVDVLRGREVIQTLKEGEMFGVRSLFEENERYSFTLTAGSNVRLYYIGREGLKKYLDGNPGVYIRMRHYGY